MCRGGIPNAKQNEEAKQRVEELISRLTKAVETELSNPDRIRRYANALAGPPEESTFALRELRRSGKAVPPVLAAMLREKLADDVRSAILGAIPLLARGYGAWVRRVPAGRRYRVAVRPDRRPAKPQRLPEL